MEQAEKYLKQWGFHPKDFAKPLGKLGLSPAVLGWLKNYIEKFGDHTEEGIVLIGNPRITAQIVSRIVFDLAMKEKFKHQVTMLDIPTYIVRYPLFEQYEKAQKETHLFDLMALCDLVIFQEMGMNQLTPTQQTRLYTLIQARYSARKPFIVTAPCDVETLEMNLGQSIQYRIISPNTILEISDA
jgi:DNA replication protein DnaC